MSVFALRCLRMLSIGKTLWWWNENGSFASAQKAFDRTSALFLRILFLARCAFSQQTLSTLFFFLVKRGRDGELLGEYLNGNEKGKEYYDNDELQLKGMEKDLIKIMK